MAATATLFRHSQATPLHPTRGFAYFDIDDQLGVTGSGATVEHAFEAVAAGVFAVMTSTTEADPEYRLLLDFEEPNLDRALVRWVDCILEVARSEAMDLTRFKLRRIGYHWYAEVWGRPRARTARHMRHVNAADPSSVSVVLADGVWQARCLVNW